MESKIVDGVSLELLELLLILFLKDHAGEIGHLKNEICPVVLSLFANLNPPLTSPLNMCLAWMSFCTFFGKYEFVLYSNLPVQCEDS